MGLHSVDAYDRFCRALEVLKTGIGEFPPPVSSPVAVYGLAHAFNVCFEQAWKFLKMWGERDGHKEAASGSPRTILKLAYRAQWIEDEAEWIEMLKARQRSVHADGEELGADLMGALPHFIHLLSELQEKAENHFR